MSKDRRYGSEGIFCSHNKRSNPKVARTRQRAEFCLSFVWHNAFCSKEKYVWFGSAAWSGQIYILQNALYHPGLNRKEARWRVRRTLGSRLSVLYYTWTYIRKCRLISVSQHFWCSPENWYDDFRRQTGKPSAGGKAEMIDGPPLSRLLAYNIMQMLDRSREGEGWNLSW